MALDLRPLRNAIRVKASGPCPACDDEAWVAGEEVLTLASVDPFGGLMPSGLEVVPFVCTNCGYVRLHAIQALETIDD